MKCLLFLQKPAIQLQIGTTGTLFVPKKLQVKSGPKKLAAKILAHQKDGVQVELLDNTFKPTGYLCDRVIPLANFKERGTCTCMHLC